MNSAAASTLATSPHTSLAQRYRDVRQQTLSLAQPLSEADMTIQAAEFVSPGKWHLAHTTWFFEEFFLNQLALQSQNASLHNIHPLKPRQAEPALQTALQLAAEYRFLFNSYYETVGNRQAQGKRGLITRPDLAEVLRYRAMVDEGVIQALRSGVSDALASIIELGLHHEQQHQELLLTDTLYNFFQNPIFPAYQAMLPAKQAETVAPQRMLTIDGGLHVIGHDGQGYGFDNEFPQHKIYLEPYQLANTPVSNQQWMDFIEDGGYQQPLLWLADGWKSVQGEQWQMPHYWIKRDNEYRCMTLSGLQRVDPHSPVCHISYFEADAYARWAGKRLPTEGEWEVAAQQQLSHRAQPAEHIQGHFADSGDYQPRPAAPTDNQAELLQLFGTVWEWTSSPYIAYPGFKTSAGAVGEYNGKFMNGQYVLRGGSCVTPVGHIRPTYRNFFYPHQRWQFSGLRLAE